MPRYMRESATTSGSAIASVQTGIRTRRSRTREEMSKASPT